ALRIRQALVVLDVKGKVGVQADGPLDQTCRIGSVGCASAADDHPAWERLRDRHEVSGLRSERIIAVTSTDSDGNLIGLGVSGANVDLDDRACTPNVAIGRID